MSVLLCHRRTALTLAWFQAPTLSEHSRVPFPTMASVEAASVAAVAPEEPTPNYTDKEKMLQLFQVESGLEPDEEVATSAVELLEDAKITKGWQVRKLSDKLLEKVVSPDSHLQEYLLITEVRDLLVKWSEEPPPPAPAPAESSSSAAGFAMMAEALNCLREENAKQREETAKARKQRRRNRSSDSEDELKEEYNCTASLEKYKLFGIPNIHFPKEKDMESYAKKASTAYKQRGSFLLKEPVSSFPPIWFEGKNLSKSVDQIPTHAHCVASYWARALAQLSAQGTCGLETVSVSEILVEFLNANKVAIEQTTKAGWEYDRHLWTDLSDRLKRREPDVEVQKTFLKLDPTQVTAAVQKVSDRNQSKDKNSQPDSAQQAKTTTKVPTGGKGGKYGGGKDTGKWGTGTPRNPFPVANDFWGSGGGNPTKGKGGGKPWGKD